MIHDVCHICGIGIDCIDILALTQSVLPSYDNGTVLCPFCLCLSDRPLALGVNLCVRCSRHLLADTIREVGEANLRALPTDERRRLRSHTGYYNLTRFNIKMAQPAAPGQNSFLAWSSALTLRLVYGEIAHRSNRPAYQPPAVPAVPAVQPLAAGQLTCRCNRCRY